MSLTDREVQARARALAAVFSDSGVNPYAAIVRINEALDVVVGASAPGAWGRMRTRGVGQVPGRGLAQAVVNAFEDRQTAERVLRLAHSLVSRPLEQARWDAMKSDPLDVPAADFARAFRRGA